MGILKTLNNVFFTKKQSKNFTFCKNNETSTCLKNLTKIIKKLEFVVDILV